MPIRPICLLIFITVIFSNCGKKTDDVAPNNPDPTGELDTVMDVSSTPASYAGYHLLWNDEFNGTTIDTSKWTFETGTGVNGDFGTGQLDYATDRVENTSIVKGSGSNASSLAVTTRKESFGNRSYTSARLSTLGKAAFGPGTRIEARVWPKGVAYKGQGFAFWMMPSEKPADQDFIMWPQGGEIDIMEYVGAIPYYNLASVHYAWSWENNQYQSWNHGHQGGYYGYADKQVPNENPSYGQWPASSTNAAAGRSGFHVYRIDWYDERIDFAIDGVVYHQHYFNDGDAFDGGVADGQDAAAKVVAGGKRIFKSEYSNHFPEWRPFERKFFILLTAGVGGNDNLTYGGAIAPNAVFPATTLIDWVRVYERE